MICLKHFCRPSPWVLLIAWFSTGLTLAQLPDARLDSLFPPGGQAGQQVELTVAGGHLDDAEGMWFSHSGITAEPKYSDPDPFLNKRRRLPRQFAVAIAGDVPPGIYEAQTVGRSGTSNPRSFMVGALREVTKSGEPNSFDQAQQLSLNATVSGRAQGGRYDYYALELVAEQEVTFEVWAERIDSQMDATLTLFDDQGRELAQSRNRRGLDPLIRFLTTKSGRYVVRVHDFLFGGGGNHVYRMTASDLPQFEVAFPPAIERAEPRAVIFSSHRQAAFRFADTAAAEPGRQVLEITARGPAADEPRRLRRPWDVGHPEFAVHPAGELPPLQPTWVGVVEDPLVPEQESGGSAQAVEIPRVVVGQFRPGDTADAFDFQAAAGEEIWLEVQSWRLGHLTDPFLVVQRLPADGGQPVDVLEADDGPALQGGFGFDRASRDPQVLFKVPETGRYRVQLRDLFAAQAGDPPHAYLLSLRKPRPDFCLLTLPDSPWKPDGAQPQRWQPPLRRGGAIAIQVLVVRREGFGGSVRLALAGLPDGVTCQETVVDAAQTRGTLVLVASDEAPEWSGSLRIVGRGEWQGKKLERVAEHATLIWDSPGKDAETQARLTSRFAINVVDELSPVSVAVETADLRETCRTGSFQVPFTVTKRGDLKEQLKLGAVNLPNGVKAEIQIDDDKPTGELRLNVAAEAVPGQYSVYLAGRVKLVYREHPAAAAAAEADRQALAELLENWQAAEAPPSAAEMEQLQAALQQASERAEQRRKTAEAKERSMHVVSEPITFRVAAAPISVELPRHGSVAAGQLELQLPLRIERRYGFEGAVQLQVAEEGGLPGISIAPIEIPAAANEAQLTVAIAAEAAPGTHQIDVELRLENNGQALTLKRPITLEIAASS